MLIHQGFIVGICLLAHNAALAGNDKRLHISDVFVNSKLNQIVISGSGFDDPEISLGEYNGFLTPVGSIPGRRIIVRLPKDIDDGEYKLSVVQGENRFDYKITIGASEPISLGGKENAVDLEHIPGYEVITKMSDINRISYKLVVSTCPEGIMLLVGSGNVTFQPAIVRNKHLPKVVSNYRFDRGEMWVAEAQGIDVSFPWQLVVKALCANRG